MGHDMDFNQLLGTLARSSAQAVSTLSKFPDEIEELKKYLYVETDIEKKFVVRFQRRWKIRAITSPLRFLQFSL